MPKERYRFFNGREIEEITLPSKLGYSGLEYLLWEIQKWSAHNHSLDDATPQNIHALLKSSG